MVKINTICSCTHIIIKNLNGDQCSNKNIYHVTQDWMEPNWYLLKIHWLWEYSFETAFSFGNMSYLQLEPTNCILSSFHCEILPFSGNSCPSNWNVHWLIDIPYHLQYTFINLLWAKGQFFRQSFAKNISTQKRKNLI